MNNTFEQFLRLQTVLFESGKRAEVLGIQLERDEKTAPKKCYIYRNEACEPIFTLAEKFFERSGLSISYEYGDYDDSLQAFDQKEKDIVVIFYNLDRVEMDLVSFQQWLEKRLLSISSMSKRTFFVYYSQKGKGELIKNVVSKTQEIVCLNLNEIFSEKIDLFDVAREKLTGTVLNNRLHLDIAKYIGGKFLPCAMNIQYKCVVTDLDNTLFGGILGEDGIDGVDVALMSTYHQLLKQLKNQGIFLAISSKNDESLVRDFFTKRGHEIGLSFDDFTAFAIGWMPKSKGIKSIANQLRISEDSLVFVDDNHSEIVEVLLNTHLKNFVQMRQNVQGSVDALNFFPGGLRLKASAEDSIRHNDLLANTTREKLLKENEEGYYRQLEMIVTIKKQNINIERFVELSNKTNQFNLSFKRYSLSDAKKMMIDHCCHLYTFSLKDKLSDSGIVGMLSVEISDKICIVKEFCISCRALGRKLEDVFIFEAIFNDHPEVEDFIFEYSYQERNQPFYNWLSRFSSFSQKQDDMSLIKINIKDVQREYIRPEIIIERE